MKTINFEYLKFTDVPSLEEFLLGIDYSLYGGNGQYSLDLKHRYMDIYFGDYILKSGLVVQSLTEEEFNDLQIN